MKNLVINSFIFKGNKYERKNFNLTSDSNDESTLKPLILDKLGIDSQKWEFEKDTFEFLPKENVVIYKCYFKEKNED
jgi:hypothetical protein